MLIIEHEKQSNGRCTTSFLLDVINQDQAASECFSHVGLLITLISPLISRQAVTAKFEDREGHAKTFSEDQKENFTVANKPRFDKV